MKICPKCGAVCEDDANFCGQCQTALGGAKDDARGVVHSLGIGDEIICTVYNDDTLEFKNVKLNKILFSGSLDDIIECRIDHGLISHSFIIQFGEQDRFVFNGVGLEAPELIEYINDKKYRARREMAEEREAKEKRDKIAHARRLRLEKELRAGEQGASGDAKSVLAGMHLIYDALHKIEEQDQAREQDMADIKRSLKEIRDASVERNSTLKVIKICVIVIALIALFFLADSIYTSHKIGSSVRDLERMFRNF